MKFRKKIAQQVKPKSIIWGYVACISALLYAGPHLWWGMGISVAFPGDYKSLPNNVWSIAIGFWTMGFVAVLAALFALSFIKSWGQRLPRLMLLTLGWIASVGLTFWGLGFFYLRFFIEIGRVISSPQFIYQDSNIHPIIWGYIWYSLFLIWGISLGLTVFQYQRRSLVQNGEVNKMSIDT
ncbi:DUF3995 domain-containing protein [Ectobacillus funiculus]|uniref:DUF3995 domain-containing protein n=1 Tax=Ectobacillus funiculus TaxID=137993 RepID=A0ABV5WFD6_9BACI